MTLNIVRRIYIDSILSSNIKIDAKNKLLLNRIKIVLRAKVGDQYRLFNSVDGEFLAEVTNITKKEIVFLVKTKLREVEKEPKLEILIPQIKQERLKWLVEKSTELGVTNITFFRSVRTQKEAINIDKIISYAISASEQSERVNIPEVSFIDNIYDYLRHNPKCVFVMLNEHEKEKFIDKTIISKSQSYIFGPEGGFDNDETQRILLNNNVVSAHLGKRILRTETAVLFMLSAHNLFHFDNVDFPRSYG